MKKIILILLSLAAAGAAFAAHQSPVTGSVIDEEGNAVEFANVIFMRDSVQVRGVATGADGRFSASLPDGDYSVHVQFLGYEPAERTVTVPGTTDCGTFTLVQSANEMDAVVVRAPIVRREADRFVVDVANAASALGKDGIELLSQAPGVWVSEDKIQINGKSGSKVYVDGRELKMDSEQLLTYLRSLRTEDIQKIEVVPQTGADFDADSSGGVIMITLRRRRDDGMMGTVSFYTSHGRYGHDYSPNASINYHKNRLDLYASGWGWLSDDHIVTTERTRYASTDALLESASDIESESRNYGGKAGAVYELGDRHSIGGEFQYYHDGEPSENASGSSFTQAGAATTTDSRYLTDRTRDHYSATLNYIWKIDTLGSSFKILADYTHRDEDSGNDNRTLSVSSEKSRDSVYRDNAASRYDIMAVTAALEKNFSQKWQLKAGVKYTRNGMYNKAVYEYRKDGAWTLDSDQSFRLDYTENIAAAYGIVSARLGRWSLVAGVRGEYTSTRGKGDGVKQDYFSLFPNANLSYMLRADGSHMLVAQYSRNISRPSFWALSPNRMPISDYTYQIGNPNLDPSYSNEISVTYILKQKYSFSASAQLSRDGMQQFIMQDPDNPDMLCLTTENFGKTDIYYFSANLPFQLTPWWTLNANLAYGYYGMTVPPGTEMEWHHIVHANLSAAFTLPRKFVFDINYFGSNKLYVGNTAIDPQHRLSLSLKKRLLDDRLTLSVSADNVLGLRQTITVASDDFSRRMQIKQSWNCAKYSFRIAWNFQSGKQFRNRSVESGAGEDTGRLK